MAHTTDLILGIFGVTLGIFVLVMGAHALGSQEKFLHLYNRWQKTERLGVKPFGLDYFGGPTKLRILGAGLVALGLFVVTSMVAITLSHLRHGW